MHNRMSHKRLLPVKQKQAASQDDLILVPNPDQRLLYLSATGDFDLVHVRRVLVDTYIRRADLARAGL